MVGGEEAGRWCSMICLGFEDSSELTPSPLCPHWPVLGPLSGKWGNIMDQKTVLSLTLLQSVSLRYIIWLIFWPARIEIVRLKNL